MKKRLLSLLLVFLFVMPFNAFAYTVLEQSGDIFINDPVSYDSPSDTLIVDMWDTGNTAQSVKFQQYDSTWSTVLNEKTKAASDYGYTHWSAISLNCNTNYALTVYDSANIQIGFMKITITEIVNQQCDGSSTGDPPPTEEPLPTSPDDCDESLICQCIESLKPALDQISANTGGELSKLTELVTTSASMDQSLKNIDADTTAMSNTLSKIDTTTISMDDTLKQILDEMRTSTAYPMPAVPDFGEPSYTDPNLPITPHINNTVRFTDPGDDVEPPLLPNAPEPKDWEGITREVELLPSSELVKETEIQKSVELQKEQELILDVFTQDEEKIADKFTQSAELQKETMIQEPVINKDSELSPDVFSQSYMLNRDQEFTPSFPMQADPVPNQLPTWKQE